VPQHCWRADPPAERLAVQLDDLTAIFHRPSASTHLVAAPVPEILAALASGPAEPAALLVRLGGDHLVEGDIAALEARLAEMEAAGLVFRR
jgi:PqqD family protein of HPr-rel-A system